MPIISGADYYTIAQRFSEAYEGQVALIDKFYQAVQALKCLDDIEVTVDLLGEFYTTYSLNKSRLESTQAFESAVLKLQQHVARESGLTVTAWIQAEIKDAGVNAGGIPEGWAVLSKAVGFNIDSMIDPAQDNSSSSDSSQS